MYDREPYVRVHLLQVMEDTCLDISVDACQGWTRHARGFFSPAAWPRPIKPVMWMRFSGLTQTNDRMLRKNNVLSVCCTVWYTNKNVQLYVHWLHLLCSSCEKVFEGEKPQATSQFWEYCFTFIAPMCMTMLSCVFLRPCV